MGCNGGDTHHDDATHHENGEHHEHAHYQCPMDCEDGKTYEEAGKCPVCEMDMEEVETE